MKLLKKILSILYFGVNFVWGFFWKQGYYYTYKFLGLCSIIVILDLILPYIISYIKRKKKKMEEEERQFEVEEMEYEKFLREITAKDDEVPMSVCEINGQDCILFFENANVTK